MVCLTEARCCAVLCCVRWPADTRSPAGDGWLGSSDRVYGLGWGRRVCRLMHRTWVAAGGYIDGQPTLHDLTGVQARKFVDPAGDEHFS
eukprot:COSAG01_NODE_20883_length_929_cov_43.393976_2_plen_89_part_00